MTVTPVVLIAFNRPEVTRRTLGAIAASRPTRLFLICDGPRATVPGDAERCAGVRAVLDEIDWPCEVTRLFSDVNLGVEANVELGLDQVFAAVDRAIVLEDDCFPDPTFFTYADELLDRYAGDPRVWQIAGNGLNLPAALFCDHSYAFSAWASVWGWATWADRWQAHRAAFPRTHVGPDGDRPVRMTPPTPHPGQLVTASARRHFAEAAVSEDVVTHGWDKHWWLTVMAAGGLCATPSHSMVENVGFGADATHTVGSGADYGRARPMAFPLVHPDTVVLDVEVERELELILNRVGGRTATLARRLVRSPTMRRVLRSAADSAPATATARALSRLTTRRAR
ncbi:glycosyltransferase family A protein [Nocardioides sp. Kera G14]|uniref:glycosyltransferase family A protein n=1 Tax=Nocardioides sp. Kera G14 TaxID=2884264 RepID=UPI001D10C397|nr:glycosyltransferase family A protein [Nocardioides sp. Kera G14]UDY23614.1 glycosyltransferase family 2 protein [Nocardioides sp. Kera G14]